MHSSIAVLICTFAICFGFKFSKDTLTYKILTTWDNQKVDHDGVCLYLTPQKEGLQLAVLAPFFNDPPNPGGIPGEPFPQLWDYEVVEAFFLNNKNHYLEVEISPHGQHLILFLKGYRDSFKDQLPLQYTATIQGSTWTGKALIPWEYFPHHVTRFNAYAIHGSNNKRVYESLYPVPKQKFSEPDFHRLDYFKEINLKAVAPEYWNTPASEYWKSVE